MAAWTGSISFLDQKPIPFDVLNFCILISIFAGIFWLGLIWQRFKAFEACIEAEYERKAAAPPTEPAQPPALPASEPAGRSRSRISKATAFNVSSPPDGTAAWKQAIRPSLREFMFDLIWIIGSLVFMVFFIAAGTNQPVNLGSLYPSLSSIVIVYTLCRRFRLWKSKPKVNSEAAPPPPGPTPAT